MGDRNRDIIIKADQEPAAHGLLRAVVDKKLLECVDMQRPEGRTVIEESLVQSSASNGIVERAIQEIEGRIRAIYLQLEERIGRDIDARERIIAFIPEYAAYLTNRLHKWMDGKTAYERTRGKKPRVLGIEFGERVLYFLKKEDKMAKISAKFDEGVFVGVKATSGEILVANEDGIHEARCVKRIPSNRDGARITSEW